jgi:polysaccharide chain length determinant protein (PEP-CTERM system associated)
VRKHSLNEIVSLIVRRRWVILVPFAVGVALAPFLARYAPPRYRSEALIVVIPQQVPNDFVRPTVSQPVEERLPSITDQILSRTKLQHIVEDLDLYRAERARNVMEDVVDRMRADVSTSAVGRNVDSFRIGYVSDNAEKAQKVTERLASLYINQNTQERAAQADHTSVFLAAQLADVKRQLVDQEKKLEDYSKSHAGQLPSQLQANLQAIQNANMQLQSLSESTNRAQERRFLIDRQIADALAVPDTPTTAPVIPTPAGEVPVATLSTAQQLELARARRTALLQRFTPDYPEVARLEQTIVELAERLAREAPVSDSAATRETRETPANAAEAAQQRKVRDLRDDLTVIDYQLGVNKTEADRLKAAIAQYQAKVDALPSRESELVELTRDYSTIQTLYANLLMKSQDSVIAANLERGQIGEQFKLVDQASMPERPYNQRQRQTMMASGPVAGLVLGLLVVMLLEIRDSSFRHAEEVIATLSVPVLASIPIMKSDRQRQAAKRRRRVMDVAGATLLLAAGVVLVLWRR